MNLTDKQRESLDRIAKSYRNLIRVRHAPQKDIWKDVYSLLSKGITGKIIRMRGLLEGGVRFDSTGGSTLVIVEREDATGDCVSAGAVIDELLNPRVPEVTFIVCPRKAS